MARRGRRHPSGRRRNGSPLSQGLSLGEAFDQALKRPLSAASPSSAPSTSSASSLLLAATSSSSSSLPALSASASLGSAATVSWRRERSWTMVPDIPKSVPRRVDAAATLRVAPKRRKAIATTGKEEEATATTTTAPRPNFLGFLLLPLAAATTEVRPSVTWDSISGTSASLSGRLGGIGGGGASTSSTSVPGSGSQLTLDASAAWPRLFAVDRRRRGGGGGGGGGGAGGNKRARQQQQQHRPSTPPPLPPPPFPPLSLALLARPPLSSLSVSASQAYRAPSYGAFVTRGFRARLEPRSSRGGSSPPLLSGADARASGGEGGNGSGGGNGGGGRGGGARTLLEAWATARPVVVASSPQHSSSAAAAAAASASLTPSGPCLAPRALTAEICTDLGTTQLSLTAEVGSPQALSSFFGNNTNNSSDGNNIRNKRVTFAIKVTAFTLAGHHGGGSNRGGAGGKRRQSSRSGEGSSSMRPASAYEGSFFSSRLNSLHSTPSWLSSLPLPDGARVEGGLSLQAPRWLASAARRARSLLPPFFFGRKAAAGAKAATATEAATTTTTTTTATATTANATSPLLLPPPRLSVRGALCTGGGARGALRSRSWRAEARLSGIVLGGEEEDKFPSSSSSSSFSSSSPRILDLTLRVGPRNARAAFGRGSGHERVELFAEALGNGNGGGGVSRSGSGIVGATTAAATAATSTPIPPPPPPPARTNSGGLMGSLANLSLASVAASAMYGETLRVGVAWGGGCGGGGGGGRGGNGGGTFPAASPPWQSAPGGDSLVGPADAEADASSVGGEPSGCVCAVREKRGRVGVRAWAFLPF